jgi:hypothetical protein
MQKKWAEACKGRKGQEKAGKVSHKQAKPGKGSQRQ